MQKLYASAAVVATAALLLGSFYTIYAQRNADPFAACRSGAVAGGTIGGPFTLVDEAGATVIDKEVLAKPVLVYFGYSSCGDVCPLDNARNAEAADILEKQGFDVTPIFITVDPARDTPQVMAAYTDNLSPKMLGLTGSEEQIKAAAQSFKVYYHKADGTDEFYEVDHSTSTYLMLPGLGFADFFSREATAKEIADRTSCFLKASS